MNKKYRILKLYQLTRKIAAPISSDYIENIFSPEIREVIPPSTNILIYHGTCTNKLKDIIAHGSLDPNKSAEGKTWEETSPGIYVTTKITGFSSSAEFYAHKAATVHGGEPIILELSIPISWIESDPDDTRIIEETQSLNEAGKVQGRVTQPIPINKITKVYEPEVFGARGMREYTFASYIEKLLKEKSTERKHKKHLKEKLPLANKLEPVIDIENTMADALSSWHNNIFGPYKIGKNGLTVFDNALIFSFKNKDKNALQSLKEFCEIMADDYSEIESYPEEYRPKIYESLRSFLRRYQRS